ncbi:hypothetical protein [Agarilytica rhodophyticola]|uniref:hypothetical protein n=1 Tax=Agarilytica rhodophyticola TaxID=1737490 RepID=UPI000B344885|nr:hypothetical protein [Agarilytica rhodophyticola]
MLKDKDAENGNISLDIIKIVDDSQRLISYIAKNGDIELDPDVTNIIVQAKYKISENQWGSEDEVIFLSNYDKLAKIIYPVTVESLNAIIPTYEGKRRKKTNAEKAVSWYRRNTIFALIFLLTIQAYWLFGHQIRANLIENISERKIISEEIEDLSPGDKKLKRLKSDLNLQNQEFDANNSLLNRWNKVWSFGAEFKGTMPKYFQTVYEGKKSEIESYADANNQALVELEQSHILHTERIKLFENILSSGFVLDTFQGYFLPLLYGLLGAFIFILRTLMMEIKSMTYTMNSEIKFRLRLTLGALGGMIIGWFLKPDNTDALASLSPMALAFLMGYNVDVLFSIMDRIVDNISQSINKNESNLHQSK